MLYATIDSPIGELLLLRDGLSLRGLFMQEGRTRAAVKPEWERSGESFDDVQTQLAEYFAGPRTAFELPLVLEGTPFQRRVWSALRNIPYGQTISYGELARRIGQPSASRAVGLANGRNPVSGLRRVHDACSAESCRTLASCESSNCFRSRPPP